MRTELTLKKGLMASYRNEVYNMVIDRARDQIKATNASMTSVTVPTIDMMTLARVLVNGEGEITIKNIY